MAEVMKAEVVDGCSVCGSRTDDLATLEEHDATMQAETPLRTQFLSLSQNKRLPSGQVCGSCVSRACDAYRFQAELTGARAPPLSARIEALRRKLLDLSRKIDVFLVVGDAAHAGQVGHEHEVIMVDRAALEAASDTRALRPEPDTRGDHVYQCTVCPQAFHKVSLLTSHAASHPPDAPHSCWTCGAQFASRAALSDHAVHHQRVCVACGARVPPGGAGGAGDACGECAAPLPPAPAAHAAHRQRHYVCGYDGCILRFATRNHLLGHIRSTHATQEETARAPTTTCDVCQQTFGNAATLARHRTEHHSQSSAPPGDGSVEVEYLEVEDMEEVLLDVKPGGL